MSIVSDIKAGVGKIESEALKIENVIAKMFTAIDPILLLVNPKLEGVAKLTVELLNTLALNISEITTQTAISSTIAAIHANPEIAGNVLSNINFSAFTQDVVEAGAVAQSVQAVAAIVSPSMAASLAPITSTIETVEKDLPQSPQRFNSSGSDIS